MCIRDSLEEPGKFIMIEGLEMTTDPSVYSVHTNPMNIIATKMRRVIQFSGKPTTLTSGSLSKESSWLQPAVLKAWRS